MKNPENLSEDLPIPSYGTFIKNVAHGKYLKFGHVHTDNQRIAFVHPNYDDEGTVRYIWTLSSLQSDTLLEIQNPTSKAPPNETPGYLYLSPAMDGDDHCIYSTDDGGRPENYFKFLRVGNAWRINTQSGLALKAGYSDKGAGDNQVYAGTYIEGDERFLWVFEDLLGASK
jgi:hypothetical protein